MYFRTILVSNNHAFSCSRICSEDYAILQQERNIPKASISEGDLPATSSDIACQARGRSEGSRGSRLRAGRGPGPPAVTQQPGASATNRAGTLLPNEAAPRPSGLAPAPARERGVPAPPPGSASTWGRRSGPRPGPASCPPRSAGGTRPAPASP